MPFALYSINSSLIKKFENIKSKQLIKFINDIEELNISQKAILIHQTENNILENLENKNLSISNENLDIQLQEKRILLEDMSRIIGFSLKCKLNNNCVTTILENSSIKDQLQSSIIKKAAFLEKEAKNSKKK